GMGSVYLATHVALGTSVALKMLHRESSDDEIRARFQREGMLAARLDSAHVVRVTDLGWADAQTPYLVMELLDGCDLQAEIDARADQYALAAVLYQCLSGQVPFDSEILAELFVQIATTPPRPPTDLVAEVPAALEAAVLRGLAKDPDQRFGDVLEFAEAIAPF